MPRQHERYLRDQRRRGLALAALAAVPRGSVLEPRIALAVVAQSSDAGLLASMLVWIRQVLRVSVPVASVEMAYGFHAGPYPSGINAGTPITRLVRAAVMM